MKSRRRAASWYQRVILSTLLHGVHLLLVAVRWQSHTVSQDAAARLLLPSTHDRNQTYARLCLAAGKQPPSLTHQRQQAQGKRRRSGPEAGVLPVGMRAHGQQAEGPAAPPTPSAPGRETDARVGSARTATGTATASQGRALQDHQVRAARHQLIVSFRHTTEDAGRLGWTDAVLCLSATAQVSTGNARTTTGGSCSVWLAMGKCLTALIGHRTSLQDFSGCSAAVMSCPAQAGSKGCAAKSCTA